MLLKIDVIYGKKIIRISPVMSLLSASPCYNFWGSLSTCKIWEHYHFMFRIR